ncbi:hypothetical protein ACFQU1_19275 [Chelatococcus sp. GCM10030263]|uniref:hypothetical protein n=1 Tax=Chelatococcus sp. GCM10030263 TaxID=3273387 RepID=UPI00361A9FEE
MDSAAAGPTFGFGAAVRAFVGFVAASVSATEVVAAGNGAGAAFAGGAAFS